MIKLVVLSVVCGLTCSQYVGLKGTLPRDLDYQAEPHYAFEYSVSDPHTGDYHSQREERKGDQTQGEYSLVEPDGSRRTVQYHVQGKSGFIAGVQHGHDKGGYAQPAVYQPLNTVRPLLLHQPAQTYTGLPPESLYKPAPVYKPASLYKPAPVQLVHNHPPQVVYKPAYDGHGSAISSISFDTHGAKIATQTKHVLPLAKYY